ncbi:MAG: diguanylate cyclase [Magnetococcales bacterium]|nr:diguanylate cyclase [Magnetococcales bacterium]
MNDLEQDLTKLTLSQAHDILYALEVSLLNHEKWFEELNLCIIKKQTLSNKYTDADAYKFCGTGLWLNTIRGLIGGMGIFHDIDFLHRRLHETAFELSHVRVSHYAEIYKIYEELIVKRNAFKWHVKILEDMVKDNTVQVDPLTGIFNRKKMRDFLLRSIQAGNDRSMICIADIDHFKHINDGYGHVVGDIVLANFARYLSVKIRPNDAVFRYGGEEFLIYLSDIEQNMAVAVVEKIRQAVETNEVILPDGRSLRVTASFGLARLDCGKSIEENVALADAGLYASKEGGRNRVTYRE